MEKIVTFKEVAKEVKEVKSRIYDLIPENLDVDVSIRIYHKNGVIDTCVTWGDSSNVELSLRNDNLEIFTSLLMRARYEAKNFKYNGYKVVKE